MIPVGVPAKVAPAPDAGPRAAAVGFFSEERLGDLLQVRILEHELKARLPWVQVISRNLRGDTNPIALDGGFSVQSGSPFDCVILGGGDVGPTVALADPPDLPAAWNAVGLGSVERLESAVARAVEGFRYLSVRTMERREPTN